MNELQRLPAEVALPILPEGIQRELRIMAYRRENGLNQDPTRVPGVEQALALYRSHIRPTTLEMVRRWMADLAVTVPVPKAHQNISLDQRSAAVFAACDEFPSVCWTQATLKLALRSFDWFPGSKSIYEILKPEADKVRNILAGLEAIAKADPPLVARPADPYVLAPGDGVGYQPISRIGRPPSMLTPHAPIRTPEEQIRLLMAG